MAKNSGGCGLGTKRMLSFEGASNVPYQVVFCSANLFPYSSLHLNLGHTHSALPVMEEGAECCISVDAPRR